MVVRWVLPARSGGGRLLLACKGVRRRRGVGACCCCCCPRGRELELGDNNAMLLLLNPTRSLFSTRRILLVPGPDAD